MSSSRCDHPVGRHDQAGKARLEPKCEGFQIWYKKVTGSIFKVKLCKMNYERKDQTQRGLTLRPEKKEMQT